LICRSPVVLGKIGNSASPLGAEVVSTHPIPLGTYATIEIRYRDPYSGSEEALCLVGVVSSTAFRRSVPVSGAAIVTSGELYDEFEGGLGKYGRSFLRIIAAIRRSGEVTVPRVPPPPDAQVYLAPSEILSKLFSSSSDASIPIGHLVGRPDVVVKVNVNALTKHLFITGATGSGKSNTVAVILDRVTGLGGVTVVYDVHGEYVTLRPMHGIVRTVELSINPLRIPPSVLAKMIVPESAATVQRRLVVRALRRCRDEFAPVLSEHGVTRKALAVIKQRMAKSSGLEQRSETGDEGRISIDEELVRAFTACLSGEVYNVGRSRSKGVTEKSIESAVMKVEEFFEYARISFSQPSIEDLISPGTILVLDASAHDDEQKDYMLKVVADEILWYARHNYVVGRPTPLLFVVEEAHLFVSASRVTVSRHSIERLAREGRKFGVCLALVSQRPRNIDPNTVSQIQNLVVMKLVQDSDQRAVMDVSDALTEDLVGSLASLATGEALVLGEWIGRFPAFVKIDMHPGKRAGATPDIVSIWREFYEAVKREAEEASMHREAVEELRELLGEEP